MLHTLRMAFIYIILTALLMFFIHTVVQALRSGKIQKKYYYLKGENTSRFIERKSQPTYYWISVLINTAFAILIVHTAATIKM